MDQISNSLPGLHMCPFNKLYQVSMFSRKQTPNWIQNELFRFVSILTRKSKLLLMSQNYPSSTMELQIYRKKWLLALEKQLALRETQKEFFKIYPKSLFMNEEESLHGFLFSGCLVTEYHFIYPKKNRFPKSEFS